jgi:hypothetical protein
MSHFYASIQGNRGEATRCGTKGSGIEGHIRGWNSGIAVEGHHDALSGCDVFRVYLSGGSNSGTCELLGVLWPDGFRYEDHHMAAAARLLRSAERGV